MKGVSFARTVARVGRGAARAAVTLAALAMSASACQSSSTNMTGPSSAKCAISIPAGLPSFGPRGGEATFAVTVAAECPWTATSEAPWLSITSGTRGQGSGAVTIVASGNPTASMRRGALLISERRVDVLQTGAACEFALEPPFVTLGAEGGEGTVGITTLPGCEWSASSGAGWLSVVSEAAGTGAAILRFRADPNDDGDRVGTLTVANQSFVVSQHGRGRPGEAACALRLSKREYAAPAAGGVDTLAITGGPLCQWTASSHAAWILVTSGASGSGDGTVNLSIAPNTGRPRTGIVTVAGQTYAVTQAGGETTCSVAISGAGQDIGAAGGPASVGVIATVGCDWTASSGAWWITIASGASGTGNGTVGLVIGANSGGARAGTVNISGQTHTIRQAAAEAPVPVPCSFSLGSASATVGYAGGAIQVGLTAGAGCIWTTASQASWIAVTSGGSGSGSGTVHLSVSANTGAQRTGTVGIAGQTFTVTQAAAPAPAPVCTYSITPTTQTVPLLGGAFNVTVSTQAGCAWRAEPDAGWIQVTGSASGTGTGTVSYSVTLALLARTGGIAIAGRVLTVRQTLF